MPAPRTQLRALAAELSLGAQVCSRAGSDPGAGRLAGEGAAGPSAHVWEGQPLARWGLRGREGLLPARPPAHRSFSAHCKIGDFKVSEAESATFPPLQIHLPPFLPFWALNSGSLCMPSNGLATELYAPLYFTPNIQTFSIFR